VEYAQSLILSRNREPVVKHATERAIEQFVNLINDIILDVIVYFTISFAEEEMGMNEFRLRLKSISAYLFLRGGSYPEHHLEMIRDIFSEHDNFLAARALWNKKGSILAT
jgi:hypothetical protein